MEKLERAVGCMVGSAIGDALGMPLEGISRWDLKSVYGGRVNRFQNPKEDHPCGHLKAGQYTDDTQQTIALAESLIESKGFDMEDFAEKLKQWYLKNLNDNNFRRFPGGTSIRSCQRLVVGASPYESGSLFAKTCGSIMRVFPVGLFYNDPKEALEQGKLSSIPTHYSKLAMEASGFVAETVAYLMNGNGADEAISLALKNLQVNGLAERIKFAIENSKSDANYVLSKIGSSQLIYETLPFAVFSFLRSPEGFEEVIVTAANDSVPGDTDSIACVAGALAGAYNGYNSVPTKFKEGLEDRLYLEELAKTLIRTSGQNGG